MMFDNGKWTFAFLVYRLLKGSYNTSYSPTHSYTDGGGCYARCWPAHKEWYSACKANHDISMLSYSLTHTHTHQWNSHWEQFGDQYLAQGHITLGTEPTTLRWMTRSISTIRIMFFPKYIVLWLQGNATCFCISSPTTVNPNRLA